MINEINQYTVCVYDAHSQDLLVANEDFFIETEDKKELYAPCVQKAMDMLKESFGDVNVAYLLILGIVVAVFKNKEQQFAIEYKSVVNVLDEKFDYQY